MLYDISETVKTILVDHGDCGMCAKYTRSKVTSALGLEGLVLYI